MKIFFKWKITALQSLSIKQVLAIWLSSFNEGIVALSLLQSFDKSATLCDGNNYHCRVGIKNTHDSQTHRKKCKLEKFV